MNCGNHLKSASEYVNKKHVFIVKKKKSDAGISLFCADKLRTRGKICTWLLLCRCGFFVVYLALSVLPVNS